VAEANAQAVTGENKAQADIADANATLKVKQADAYQLAETRKREADAGVREAQYQAEARTAQALASKIELEKRAELEAVAKAEKAKDIVDAEAKAQELRIIAEGEAQATYLKLEAQARGEYEILAKKADGLKRIVEGCGGSQQAFQLLMLDQLDHLSETAAKAISNIKFDKIVVWDGQNGKSTAGFLQNLGRSLPPMLSMMKDVGGIDMPEFFGKIVGDDKTAESSDGEPAASEQEDKEELPAKKAPPARKAPPAKDKGSSGNK
jgi:flotillin